MIGIYSLLGNKSNLNKESITFDERKMSMASFQSNEGVFALVAPRNNKIYSVFDSGSDWILIDGFVFDESNKRLTAEDLLDMARENLECLKKLNGEFFLVVSVRNSTYCINDIFGQRQYCLAVNPESQEQAIAPSPGRALALADVPKNIDQNALFTFMVTKKLRFDRNTIWKHCTVLDPGTVFSFENGNIISTKYWEITYSNKYASFDVDKFIQLYKKAVNARVLSSQVGVTLTGGLDSRSMVGAVDKSNLSSLSSYTMGSDNCDEVLIAKEVAQELGITHTTFNVSPEKVLEEFSLSYFEDEDVDLIIQGLWNPFTKELENTDYLLHGLDLDVTLGGIYLTEELLEVDNDADFYNFVVKDNLRLNKAQITELFKKEKVASLSFEIDDYLVHLAQNCKGENYLQKYDRFIMYNSMNRVILQRYRGIRKNIETLSPMYDRNIIEYLYSLDVYARANYRAFYPFINKLSASLSNITYQRTMLPASAPVSFWKKSQRIESEKEELFRQISKQTNGDSYVSYTRYYTNVDEWLRFNKSWMKAVKELLQSDNSILRKEWLNEEIVDRLIAEHQNHERSHLGIIHTLMSAEVFLRIEKKVNFKYFYRE